MECMKKQKSIHSLFENCCNNVLAFMGLFILVNIVAGIVGHVCVWGMVKYIYILLTGIFMPGWLIQQRLEISFKDGVSSMFFSFGIGIASMMMVYAILLALNIQYITPFVFYGLSFISIVYLTYWCIHEKSTHCIGTDKKDFIKLFLLLLLTLGFSFATFQMSQKSPIEMGYQKLFCDSTYWLKSCVASTMGYPIPELSVQGNHLYWHLFSCFFVAALHFCTGIEFYSLCYSLTYLCDMFLLVGAIYIFFNEFVNNKRLVFMGCFILLFVGGFEKQLCFSYLEHLYQCKLGVVFGFAFALISFVLFAKSLKTERNFSKEFWLALFFFAAAEGSKTPYACILLVGIGFLYVFTCNKRNWWKNFLSIFCFLGVFLLIAKVFIIDGNALSSSSSSHQLSLSLTGSALLIPAINNFYLMASQYIGYFLAWLVSTAGFYFGINYVVICLLIISLIVAVIKRKYQDLILWAIFFMVIVGLLLFLFVHHPGRSQMYFAFVAIPFATLFSLMVYDQCDFKFRKMSLKIANGFILLSLICTVVFFQNNFVGGGCFTKNFNQKSINGNDITKDEFTALQWIKDNLSQDVVLATNKILAPNSKDSWVTSAYSERQVYFEGYSATNLPYAEIVDERISLLRSYFNGEIAAKEKLIEEGVTHAVLFKAFGESSTNLGEKLFENADVVVYQL